MTDLADASLEIILLGGFVVRVAGQVVPARAWRLRRAKTLLKLLALAPDRRLHRDHAIELLWPDEPAAGAGLHQVLYTARRALGPKADQLVLQDEVRGLGRGPARCAAGAVPRPVRGVRPAAAGAPS